MGSWFARRCANGCWFVQHGKGDHEFGKVRTTGSAFTVPANIDSRHTANKIMKDAGLEKAFSVPFCKATLSENSRLQAECRFLPPAARRGKRPREVREGAGPA